VNPSTDESAILDHRPVTDAVLRHHDVRSSTLSAGKHGRPSEVMIVRAGSSSSRAPETVEMNRTTSLSETMPSAVQSVGGLPQSSATRLVRSY
jgi:hypothetical protein